MTETVPDFLAIVVATFSCCYNHKNLEICVKCNITNGSTYIRDIAKM